MREATPIPAPRRPARAIRQHGPRWASGPLRRRGAAGREAVAAAAPQSIRIRVDNGYVPNQTRAFANEPVRLLFRRLDDDHCTERVVFSSPHFEARLAANGVTTIDLPPQSAGTIRFTCGMGRYRGQIELVERAAVRRRKQVRAAAVPAAGAVALLLALGALDARAFVAAAILAIASGLVLVSFARSRQTARAAATTEK